MRGWRRTLSRWLPLLDGWLNHPLQTVCRWAEAAHQSLVKQITRERRDDEEQDIW